MAFPSRAAAAAPMTPRRVSDTVARDVVTPSKKPAKPAPRPSFAEIGREAARVAQRAALLAELEAQGWNLSAVARELRITDTSAVIRSLKTLAPDEYEKARGDGRIAPGRPRNT